MGQVKHDRYPRFPTRRAILRAGAGAIGATAFGLAGRQAQTTPASAEARLHTWLGGVTPKRGRVSIEMPQLIDNGNSVEITVAVDSAMTAIDRVRAIFVVAEGNPNPEVAAYYLGPQSGRAKLTTRIRLAQSQTIQVAALMGDGSAWIAATEVAVTIGGCGAPGAPAVERPAERPKMAAARVRVPPLARGGEVVEIRTLIEHDMESGLRIDLAGQVIPRLIVNRFVCSHAGREIVRAEYFAAVAANPYLTFFMRAEASGPVDFLWADEEGQVHRERATIVVA
ncbi:MAG: hypothetical protein EXQ89_06180 [Rhodospirillaceae bacterium]|nr:hypothetical protein [Rhodospirillaceae bacterium]